MSFFIDAIMILSRGKERARSLVRRGIDHKAFTNNLIKRAEKTQKEIESLVCLKRMRMVNSSLYSVEERKGERAKKRVEEEKREE